MDYQIEDIEAISDKFDKLIRNNQLPYDNEISTKEESNYISFIHDLLSNESYSLGDLKMKYSISRKNSAIIKFARRLFQQGQLCAEELSYLEDSLRIKRCKSHSGVLVVTIFTSAYPSYIDTDGSKKTQPFSCKWNCHYCPNEPGQPRSYLKGEPGVMRANANDFDCCRQMWDRMSSLYDTGHPIDKLEVLVLGGTWESYPQEYRKEFIRDMYYAANTFWEEPSMRRTKASLPIERDANRNALCKIIGLTLETRPDTITEEAIINARELGCTRFQIGIQHIDNDVLKKINRQCKTEKTIQSIQLLKDWGYKVDGHWMPNLPGSSPEKDRAMFLDVLLKQTEDIQFIEPIINDIQEWTKWSLGNTDLQLDQWKIYPCEVVPFTKIEEWYKNGEYKPYSETELEDILLHTKKDVFPWIRLNRIIRDIPTDYIMASGDHPNMRQDLQCKMKKRGWKCKCIRCREVKLNKVPAIIMYRVREYDSSGGREMFISAEDIHGDTLCGFVRLRLNNSEIAWIRELHVYGQIQVTTKKLKEESATQHKGIGKKLMDIAKKISKYYEKKTIKVIAGEGVKNYYQKLGYQEGIYGYMEMNL